MCPRPGGHGPRGLRRRGAGPPAPSSEARLTEAYGRLPLGFEPAPDSAGEAFVARGGGYVLALGATEAVLSLGGGGAGRREAEPGGERFAGAEATPDEAPPAAAAVRLRLVGADPAARGATEDELPGVSNYLTGDDPGRWRIGVARHGRVRYRGAYPGVDLVWPDEGGELEYDFVVAPGADPGVVRVGIEGATALRLEKDGGLVISTPGGDVTQRAPVAYQERPGGDGGAPLEKVAVRHVH